MLFSQHRRNADKHTLTQLSFSTKCCFANVETTSINVIYQPNQSNQIDISTKYQRLNNVDER